MKRLGFHALCQRSACLKIRLPEIRKKSGIPTGIAWDERYVACRLRSTLKVFHKSLSFSNKDPFYWGVELAFCNKEKIKSWRLFPMIHASILHQCVDEGFSEAQCGSAALTLTPLDEGKYECNVSFKLEVKP